MSRTDPTFQIAFLFHDNLDLLGRVLPRCLDALTSGTAESYEVVLHCDGTPAEIAAKLPALAARWGVDEVRYRRRARFVSSGDRSTNGHRRLFATRSPYLIVIEDDVVAYRTESSFDPHDCLHRSLGVVLNQTGVICLVRRVTPDRRWRWRSAPYPRYIHDGACEYVDSVG
jgi:hypothetical protein